MCPWGRGKERETHLLEIFVKTIPIVSLIEGQFLLILLCNSGDWQHPDREVQQVVQACVGGALCRKIKVSSEKLFSSERFRVGKNVGKHHSWSFSELQPSGFAITGSDKEWPDNCLWLPSRWSEGESVVQALLSTRYRAGLSALLIL